MEREFCRKIIFLLFLFSSTALAQPVDLDKVRVKNWEFRAFSDKSFFRRASQGAAGVFVSPARKYNAQVFVYQGVVPDQAVPHSLQDWRKLVYPNSGAKGAEFRSEVSSKTFYRGQMKIAPTKAGSASLFTVLALREGDGYVIFIQSDDGGLPKAHYESVNALFSSILSLERQPAGM
jgi:hypothetical protein